MDTLFRKLLNITDTEETCLADWIEESCIDVNDFVDFVQEQAKELERCIWEVDICSMFLEYIAKDANVDELISFVIADKYNSSFEISPQKATKLIMQVPEDDRNPSWFFLADFLSLDLDSEDE